MNKLFTLSMLMLVFISCNGQLKTEITPCNRTVYGSTRYIKLLPTYICIPSGFIVDDYVRTSDTNGDGQNDFIAVKYNKREDDQVDGDSTYWSFYTRTKDDTIFSLKMTLSNLVPPFIKNLSYKYLLEHATAIKLFEDFPLRLSHRLSFQVNLDTIRVLYKFDDSYGKSFVFVSDHSNWYLKNVEYFIGELPMYWWRDNDFFYSLNDKIKIIETRKPKKEISINEFNLRTAFVYRNDERSHLSENHTHWIDKTKWSSINEVRFSKCQGIDLPDDWIY